MSPCPSPLELEAYLDVGSEVGIGPHVRNCPTCTARLKELQDDRQFLQGLRDASARKTTAPSSAWSTQPHSAVSPWTASNFESRALHFEQ